MLIRAVEECARAAQRRVDPLIAGMDGLVASLTPAERTAVASFLARMITGYDEVLARGGTVDEPWPGDGRMRR